ncbi:MAG: hypothetical protein RR840_06995 [Clostridium sp.]
MSSIYIIDGFKDYMKEVNIDDNLISYNLRVLRVFNDRILMPQGKTLDNIDVYAFEEFTDLIDIIDKELGGKGGIVNILDTFLMLTEYLKSTKLIKGGKIAYYRRIFTNTEYYIDKYESIKGKKDGSKEFIKKITKNRFSQNIVRLLEEVNIHSFTSTKIIEELLDDEYESESKSEYVDLLVSLDFLSHKGKRIITSKKGRALLRLEAEERYAAILYSLIYEAKWFEAAKEDRKYILKAISTVSSIFLSSKSINPKNHSYEDNGYLIICDSNYRLSSFLEISKNKTIFDIVFIGLGIVIKDEFGSYCLSDFGKVIMKLLSVENEIYLKHRLNKINKLLKNKQYLNLEGEIINFILVFGESTTILDYLGQVLIIKGKYKEAYRILSYGYEKSDMQSPRAKKTLTHLILCCRKLEFKGQEGKYIKKLNLIDK